ncbi:S8 family serine peptidase [Agriterribacter sp.]|uniref:S8 family serine peptidase n=1 Tax=Agriterribacter sp. TaxID=2821509 RepID=UPI002C8E57E0|nr:S8 family serine peptidase [Agriterribacter sp.]HRO48345.1 S8 family serine peptidase [Agriterribacter sp.]HRQ18649.1 S8 family serine peptidase [Agriterribacter sp.]
MLNAAFKTTRPITYTGLMALLLMVIISGCNCGSGTPQDWTTYQVKSPYEGEKPDPYKQLIVWLKPGTSRQDFNKWLQDNIVKKEKNELKVRFVCGSCDSSLFLLEGKGVELYMQGEVANGGTSSKGKPKVTGESGPLYFSTNIPVRFPDGLNELREAKLPPVVSFSGTEVKVAVFDTGLDTSFVNSSFLYKAADSACIPGAGSGWNFIAGNNNWLDDNPGKHGSTVTKFITDEVERYRQNSVAILPVKVFGADGTSDLYSILCGFAYAKNRKVDIVNASFGYYESRNKYDSSGDAIPELTSPVLLKAFIEEHLTKHNILLVTAAGNKDDAMEDPEYNPADTLQKRNLDSVYFYPASLAPVLPNVIAITTVYKDQVSPAQNFSNQVVDAGVHADGADNAGHFYFTNPVNAGLPPVSGSSFAAPVATGKYAAWHHSYKNLLNAPITFSIKDSIFSILKSQPSPSFLYNEPGLAGKVKEGKVINKMVDANQQALFSLQR